MTNTHLLFMPQVFGNTFSCLVSCGFSSLHVEAPNSNIILYLYICTYVCVCPYTCVKTNLCLWIFKTLPVTCPLGSSIKKGECDFSCLEWKRENKHRGRLPEALEGRYRTSLISVCPTIPYMYSSLSFCCSNFAA